VDGPGLRAWRDALVGDLSGEVIEIGAGTGLNFAHYPTGAHVFASDVDPLMLAGAIPRAKEALAAVEPLVGDAMRLPFASRSADVVVIGLMLCSVPDPSAALGEARRILRPGGRVRFMEHIRAANGTVRGRIQDAINPAWRVVSGGCNANRRSVEAVAGSGFDIVQLYEFSLGLPYLRPLVVGEAVLR
jgi:ubiquinone/menaquinone biosynthesis C-methylase UbiE